MFTIKHFFKFFLFFISISLYAETYQGEVQELIADDFDQQKEQTIYNLNEGDNTYELNLPPGFDKKQLKTGKKIIIQGQERGKSSKGAGFAPGLKNDEGNSKKIIDVQTIDVISNNKSSLKKDSSSTTPDVEEIPIANVGVKKIVVFLVNFTDQKATTTVSADAADKMLYTGPTSSDKDLKVSSYNQVSLMRDANMDGRPDIYTVNLNYPIGTVCDATKWANDVKAQAPKVGANLSLYKYIVMVLPQNIPCSWGGLGTVGCGSVHCLAWIRGYLPSKIYTNLIYTHELGHNLGLGHASTDPNLDGIVDSAYGDATCIMGTGDHNSIPQVNALHRAQLGWFNSYPSMILPAISGGRYALLPLDAGMGMEPRVLTFKRNNTETYYISFRKNYSPFPLLDVYANKVYIHLEKPNDTKSYFIRSLAQGETFTDTANNIKVKFVYAPTDGSYAAVQVN